MDKDADSNCRLGKSPENKHHATDGLLHISGDKSKQQRQGYIINIFGNTFQSPPTHSKDLQPETFHMGNIKESTKQLLSASKGNSCLQEQISSLQSYAAVLTQTVRDFSQDKKEHSKQTEQNKKLSTDVARLQILVKKRRQLLSELKPKKMRYLRNKSILLQEQLRSAKALRGKHDKVKEEHGELKQRNRQVRALLRESKRSLRNFRRNTVPFKVMSRLNQKIDDNLNSDAGKTSALMRTFEEL